jgi:hypothetical protein
MSQKETDQTSGGPAPNASQVIPDESFSRSQIEPSVAPVGVALWSDKARADRAAVPVAYPGQKIEESTG